MVEWSKPVGLKCRCIIIPSKKEVKKVKPYFECKVVKVKKEKPKQNYCPCCGGKIEMEKPKGNWVNGENLDKIKFPCFCSYRSHSGKKHYAEINQGQGGYKLSRLFQADGDSIFLSSDSLKKLIRKWDIHILKGKITLFEEEK